MEKREEGFFYDNAFSSMIENPRVYMRGHPGPPLADLSTYIR